MYLWHSAFLFLHHMEYWKGWECHVGFLWLYACHSPRGFPWRHSHTWLLTFVKRGEEGCEEIRLRLKREAVKNMKRQKAEFRKLLEKNGSAEKDLPQANEEKHGKNCCMNFTIFCAAKLYITNCPWADRNGRNARKACEDTIRILPKTWRSIQSGQLPQRNIRLATVMG